jgi:hypothetical protein
MMKSPPASSFIVIEPEFILELLKIPLDSPADLGKRNEFAELDLFRHRREPVLRRFRFAGRPLDQQPFNGPGSVRRSERRCIF